MFYDLKQTLEAAKAQVPAQLAQHEASRAKPGSQPTRRDQVQYARK